MESSPLNVVFSRPPGAVSYTGTPKAGSSGSAARRVLYRTQTAAIPKATRWLLRNRVPQRFHRRFTDERRILPALGGWLNATLFRLRTEQQMYLDIRDRVLRKLRAMVLRKYKREDAIKKALAKAEIEAEHQTWKEFAKEFGFRYKREQR
jgi:hypothetical protein